MAIIYETKNFILESHEKPEISREEWWHIKISPKIDVSDRTKLNDELAVELMLFSIICGKAFKKWMKNRGIKIWRINYQENWNWKPHLHIHLYWRAITAKIQKYWDPLIPWHKEWFEKLEELDILEIQKEIKKLIKNYDFKN